MRIKPLDAAAFLLAAAAIVWSSLAVYSGRGGELSAIVSGPDGEWVYPLDEARSIEVRGPLGSTFIDLHDSRVHIAASPCPNQTCVAAGEISGTGQWLACLPNEVFVRIEGRKSDGELDAAAF